MPRGLVGFIHFTSSTTLGSACLIKARRRESISPRQSPSSWILASISRDADSTLSEPLLFITSLSGLCGISALARAIKQLYVRDQNIKCGLLLEAQNLCHYDHRWNRHEESIAAGRRESKIFGHHIRKALYFFMMLSCWERSLYDQPFGSC